MQRQLRAFLRTSETLRAFVILVDNKFTIAYDWLTMKLQDDFIITYLREHPGSALSDIARILQVSRQTVSKRLSQLIRLGEVEKIGNTKGASFRLSNDFVTITDQVGLSKHTKVQWYFHKTYPLPQLAEDLVYRTIGEQTKILQNLPDPVNRRLHYTFTEMLNNAIDHSHSPTVEIVVIRDTQKILFWIVDHGVGVFRSITKRFKLKGTAEAVDLLLLGKATTAPQQHSGEGIYFTAQASDAFRINSFNTKLVVREGQATNNEVSEQDQINYITGSLIRCQINLNSSIRLDKVFNKSTTEDFSFDTTVVSALRLADDGKLISRSQAKRVVTGWEKFKFVKLDFSGITTIGQAFIDEIFRVWQGQHPNIRIDYTNASDMIKAFIKRAQQA